MIEHLRGRDRKLEPLGWTGQDAEWIALVCLHSGIFTRSQFCEWGIHLTQVTTTYCGWPLAAPGKACR